MAARYRIEKKIADGGMAEIFLATQRGAEGFARKVVLKRILAALLADPQFRNMMIDEAHVAMGLNHSNIAQVLDLGQSKGRYFLVLELVDGWDLNLILNRVKACGLELPPELGLYIMAEICRALGYAHARQRDGKPLGIVHRDISPHNVLISEQGEVKLTDFGIAKALGRRERTGQGIIKGKLAFMSPEQASGATLDARSDLFSIGTMLYQIFTGRRPFDAATDLETILRVQQGSFPPPSEIRSDLPAPLVQIIDRAMKLLPADRYQTAEALLDDIEAAQRAVYKPAGQTELKRWLAELAARDGIPPASRATALPTEAQEEELELIEGVDIVFEEVVSEYTEPLTAKEGRPSLPPPVPVIFSAKADTQVDTRPTPIPDLAPPAPTVPIVPDRRRWLLGALLGALAGASVLFLRRRPGPQAPSPATVTAAPPRPVVRAVIPPAPVDASPPAIPDARAQLSPAVSDEDEDEEKLLQQRETGVAEAVIGDDQASPVKPNPRNPRPAPKPSAPHTQDPVSLRIESHPEGAVVRMNTRVFGRAPLSLRFNPGPTYELTFVRSGYETLTKRFVVSKKKNQKVVVRLRKRAPAKRKNFLQRLFGR